MAREYEKEYNFIYKTTNIIRGYYYIGMHTTNNLNDGYYGSGKILKKSIKKYGKDAHIVEILEFFDSFDELKEREHEIVNEKLLSDPKCINITLGGTGDCYHINKEGLNLYGKNGLSGYGYENLLRGEKFTEWLDDPDNRAKHAMGISIALKNKYSVEVHPWVGRKHKESTKKMISDAAQVHQKGTGNSQFGTCWISHELVGSKKCNKELLPMYIDQGWVKGRNIFK